MCRKCDEVPIHQKIRNHVPLAGIMDEIDAGHVNQRSPCGKSPLMSSGYFCRKDVMCALIDRGAVVNALDDVTGDTAAHFITLSMSGSIRQCACLMVLIENGLDIDIRNNDGYTMHELALINGNMDIGNTGDAMKAD